MNQRLTVRAEVAAICRRSDKKDRIYSVWSWGFSTEAGDRANDDLKEPEKRDVVSEYWKKAVGIDFPDYEYD